jgi:hypothetical protein
VIALLVLLLAAAAAAPAAEKPWKRHTIDREGRGADGVRLMDVNGDGLPDIATGWEESGFVRVYLHPGHARVRDPWPKVTVGPAGSVEDAVFADLDGDGAVDVVSSSEGGTMSLNVHWAPVSRDAYLDPAAWKTEAIPASVGLTRWMFALPLRIGGAGPVDFFAGSKDPDGVIGWWRSPADPRKLADWRWHPLYRAGWVMSLEALDMDGDGDLDLLASDRKGPASGVLWLERPADPTAPWPEHRIGSRGEREVMFLRPVDLDGDGLVDVVAAVKPAVIEFHRRLDRTGGAWRTYTIPFPPHTGSAKGIHAADLNRDGRLDLVLSCEGASDGKSGVFWLEGAGDPAAASNWRPHDISGPEGVKFDLIELVDLDGDGDLDVLTCEETHNLGVIWYENPAR